MLAVMFLKMDHLDSVASPKNMRRSWSSLHASIETVTVSSVLDEVHREQWRKTLHVFDHALHVSIRQHFR
jgi:hypothetical protein